MLDLGKPTRHATTGPGASLANWCVFKDALFEAQYLTAWDAKESRDDRLVAIRNKSSGAHYPLERNIP
jgi:hypothetical protein